MLQICCSILRKGLVHYLVLSYVMPPRAPDVGGRAVLKRKFPKKNVNNTWKKKKKIRKIREKIPDAPPTSGREARCPKKEITQKKINNSGKNTSKLEKKNSLPIPTFKRHVIDSQHRDIIKEARDGLVPGLIPLIVVVVALVGATA